MAIAKPSNPISEPDTVQIANGTAISADINLAGRVPVSIGMPAAWTAAAITFEVSHDGNTFYDLYDAAEAEYDIATPVVDGWMQVNPDLFRGARYARIRSGVSATPVNQGAARNLVVSFGEPDKMF